MSLVGGPQVNELLADLGAVRDRISAFDVKVRELRAELTGERARIMADLANMGMAGRTVAAYGGVSQPYVVEAVKRARALGRDMSGVRTGPKGPRGPRNDG